jgi:hypothetical protein
MQQLTRGQVVDVEIPQRHREFAPPGWRAGGRGTVMSSVYPWDFRRLHEIPVEPNGAGFPPGTPGGIFSDPVWIEELKSHPAETLARLRRLLAHRASTDNTPHT